MLAYFFLRVSGDGIEKFLEDIVNWVCTTSNMKEVHCSLVEAVKNWFRSSCECCQVNTKWTHYLRTPLPLVETADSHVTGSTWVD